MMRFILAASVIWSCLATCVVARAADLPPVLRYQFKGTDRTYYKVTEKIEDDKGTTVTIGYVGFSPKAFRSQIELNYATSMSSGTLAPGGVPPDFPPSVDVFAAHYPDRLTIDGFGKVVASTSRQDVSLTGAFVQLWQVPLPELTTKAENTWQSTRKTAVIVRPEGPFGMHLPMPRGPFGMQQQGSVAVTTTNYSLQAQQENQPAGTQGVSFTTDFSTDGKGNFSEHLSGTGSFLFDLQHGLVQSLTEKFDADFSIQGQSQHATITVDADQLDPEQADQLAKDAASRKTELGVATTARTPTAQQRDQFHSAPTRDKDWMDSLALPDGAKLTDYVGSSGGGMPFIRVGDGKLPMIGVRYVIGSWANQAVIQTVEPIYAEPDHVLHQSRTEGAVIAKTGYVVSGIWANGPVNATAIRLIFMKKTDTGLNPKDAYVSPWIGKPIGDERLKFGSDGRWVIGFFGRQGMNSDALGVVTAAATDQTGAVTGSDPTDNPNYQGKGTTPTTPAPK